MSTSRLRDSVPLERPPHFILFLRTRRSLIRRRRPGRHADLRRILRFQRRIDLGELALAKRRERLLDVAELLPDSLAVCSREETAWAVTVGLVAMLGFTAALGL